MSKQVIILVSDDNYIEHVKSISVNCIEQGGYKGDFAVICPIGSNASNVFAAYGFYVLEVSVTSFLQKFYVFDKFFKLWDEALYMDCDIIIQDDIQRLFALLKVEDKIWMDTEDGTTLESFWRDPNKEGNKYIYAMMQEKYPNVNKQTFNSAFILFHPNSMPDNIPQQLCNIQQEIEPINKLENMGTDQQIINLLLWDLCKKIPNKLVCFWGLAEPQNDVDSEWRQFKKGDIPVGIHYTRWYSQWTKKTPDMDAYRVLKLGIPCNELYLDNLSKFDKHFNK